MWKRKEELSLISTCEEERRQCYLTMCRQREPTTHSAGHGQQLADGNGSHLSKVKLFGFLSRQWGDCAHVVLALNRHLGGVPISLYIQIEGFSFGLHIKNQVKTDLTNCGWLKVNTDGHPERTERGKG